MTGAIALLSWLALPAALADTPRRFPPGRYAVDPQTMVRFEVKSLFGAYQGHFLEPTGAVTIDPLRPDRAAIDISFPLARMTTGDTSTDEMLKGGSFFDMAHYPTVRFTAADAPVNGGNMLRVDGLLTMHGQTRPISINARLVEGVGENAAGPPTLRFTGDTSVRRSQFGMGFGRPFVANRVTLVIDARFRPA